MLTCYTRIPCVTSVTSIKTGPITIVTNILVTTKPARVVAVLSMCSIITSYRIVSSIILLCQKKSCWMVSNHLPSYHYRSMFTTYVFGMIHQDIQVYILSSKFRLLGYSRFDRDNDHMSHCIQSQMFRCYKLKVKKNKTYRIYIIYIVRQIVQILSQWFYTVLGSRTDASHADNSDVHKFILIICMFLSTYVTQIPHVDVYVPLKRKCITPCCHIKKYVLQTCYIRSWKGVFFQKSGN